MNSLCDAEIECIFHFLPLANRMHMAQTCKRHYYVADRPSAWNHLVETRLGRFELTHTCLANSGLRSLIAHEPVQLAAMHASLFRGWKCAKKHKDERTRDSKRYKWCIGVLCIVLLMVVVVGLYIWTTHRSHMNKLHQHALHFAYYQKITNREYTSLMDKLKDL